MKKSRLAFTLMEVLISSLMLVMMLLAVLAIFDQSARIARDQSELAVMQQSLRVGHQEIVRMARMAGVGGLPLTWEQLDDADVGDTGCFPNGFAVAITNNVPEGTTIGANFVLPGSDILTLRGVFTTPVYYLQGPPREAAEHWVDAGTNQIPEQVLEIPDRMGTVDYRQSLQPLIQRLEQTINSTTIANKNLPFILRDLTAPNQYSVLEWNALSGNNQLTPTPCTFDGTRNCISLALRLDNNSGDHLRAYGELGLGTAARPGAGTPSVPLPAGSAAPQVPIVKYWGSIGLLEEYRFYLRADWEIPNDKTSRLMPVLTREQFAPNTEESIERVDLVDGLVEFQLAMGFDRDWRSSSPGHNLVTEAAPKNLDEVLFNDPADFQGSLAEPALSGSNFDPEVYPGVRAWFHPQLQVHFLRITTVAQANKPSRGQENPRLGTIEDFDRSAPFTVDGQTYDLNDNLTYRRRVLRTVVDLRNLK